MGWRQVFPFGLPYKWKQQQTSQTMLLWVTIATIFSTLTAVSNSSSTPDLFFHLSPRGTLNSLCFASKQKEEEMFPIEHQIIWESGKMYQLLQTAFIYTDLTDRVHPRGFQQSRRQKPVLGQDCSGHTEWAHSGHTEWAHRGHTPSESTECFTKHVLLFHSVRLGEN